MTESSFFLGSQEFMHSHTLLQVTRKLLQDSPVGIFLFLNDNDKHVFSQIANGEDVYGMDLEKYALTQDMLNLLKEGAKKEFKRQRDSLLINAEKELLQ